MTQHATDAFASYIFIKIIETKLLLPLERNKWNPRHIPEKDSAFNFSKVNAGANPTAVLPVRAGDLREQAELLRDLRRGMC